MFILSMGAIGHFGRGVEALRQRLLGPWVAPSPLSEETPGQKAYTVPADALKDRTLLKRMRRADRLSRMAAIAAADCLEGIEPLADRTETGIITATALGPHATTFRFLDDILDYGDAEVSPITFSNSVHNAAASYVAEAFSLNGPTLTVTNFLHSVHEALALARAWLATGRLKRVLVIAAEQHGDVLHWVMDSKLAPAKDGMLRPFTLGPGAGQVPGEAAVAFLLSDEPPQEEKAPAPLARVLGREEAARPDLLILDSDGLLPDEACYLEALEPGVPVASYSPQWGSIATGSALSAAAAALMLYHNELYPLPVTENPRGLGLASARESDNIEIIEAGRYNWRRGKASILLGKNH